MFAYLISTIERVGLTKITLRVLRLKQVHDMNYTVADISVNLLLFIIVSGLLVFVDLKASDSGYIGCRIPLAKIDAFRKFTVFGM